MELVTPQELSKPRNVNWFKKGLEKLQMPNLLPVVEEVRGVWMRSQLLMLRRQLPHSFIKHPWLQPVQMKYTVE